MREIEIAVECGITFTNYEDIGDKLKDNSKTRYMMKKRDEYNELQQLYKEFKNKKFECTNVDYDISGNITKMEYKEK